MNTIKCPQCHQDALEVYEHASFGDGLGGYWHCGECHRKWCERTDEYAKVGETNSLDNKET